MSHNNKILTVAFSGAGHLLAYHLGVAAVLLEASATAKKLPPIKAVSGSSSGAIAATVMAYLPHRLKEYSDRFLQDRGHAFRNLKQMLIEEENQQNSSDSKEVQSPALFICATKSEDGSAHLFLGDFQEREKLLKSIQASCRIPISFHPADMLKSNSTYVGEGIEIDGELYVDGGIAAPFPPPSPIDLNTQHNHSVHRILVSPIELKPPSYNENHHYICPSSSPNNANISSFWYLKTRNNLRICPSLENFRALMVAGGFASSSGQLRSWYERGMDNAHDFVDNRWKFE